MTCSYDLTPSGLPPCLIFTHNVYKDLHSFLNFDGVFNQKDELLTNEINCISFDKLTKVITIDQDQCISCGSCAFSCPGEKINFTKDIKAIPSCSNFRGHSDLELNNIKENIINFSNNFLNSFNKEYKSFEKFTGIKETKNIAVWGGNVAKYLFGDDAKIGLEIPLTIEGRNRNGRLDICILSKKTLIVIEAKIGLKKLLNEGRYQAQILAYDEELQRLDLMGKMNISSIRLLLIGDDEKTLLPQTNDLCTSKVGNLSNIFYRSILEHNIKFISARGLLSLAMSKFSNSSTNLDETFIKIFKDHNTLGLISNTLIKRHGDNIYLESLNL